MRIATHLFRENELIGLLDIVPGAFEVSPSIFKIQGVARVNREGNPVTLTPPFIMSRKVATLLNEPRLEQTTTIYVSFLRVNIDAAFERTLLAQIAHNASLVYGN